MKKNVVCEDCGGHGFEEYNCDTCEKDLLSAFHGIPITVDFSYGNELDGSTYHFCDYKCLLRFITQELRKQNPVDERFEFGKGEQNEPVD